LAIFKCRVFEKGGWLKTLGELLVKDGLRLLRAGRGRNAERRSVVCALIMIEYDSASSFPSLPELESVFWRRVSAALATYGPYQTKFFNGLSVMPLCSSLVEAPF